MRLYLASTSPRRRELLRWLGLPFDLLAPEVDEARLPGEPADSMVRRLSLAKARACAHLYPNDLIIAADTTVLLDGDVLGKPVDATDAVSMLSRLRGLPHVVYSGVAVLGPGREWSYVCQSTVWMRDLTDVEIASYVASGDPLDKAAAYAVQHRDFRPVARVEGCFANVMGLPVCRVAEVLREFGAPVRSPGLACYAHPESDCSVPAGLGI